MSISHETVTNYKIYYLTQAQYDALVTSGSITVDGQTIQYDPTAEYRTPDNIPEELSTKYVKPVDGIPKTDLSDAVQTSLDKADTALQQHQSLAAYRTAVAQDVIDAAKTNESAIAPTEDGSTASQAYAQGAYFFHNGDFCKAKTAIASGAAFTLNTNYKVTSVSAELGDSGGGGTSIDLGITGASAGDLIKVSAVDGSGKPTAWAKATAGTDYQTPLIAGTDYEKPVKRGSISLSTTWSGNGPYTQTVTVTGVTATANSKVDLQPDATALAQLISDGVTALFVTNNNGTLTATAIGAATTAALTIQCTVTEVSA